MNYKFNAKETKDKLVKWIKDWFEVNGKDCCAVIGISGGKDSSVVAALCVEALGKDRVFGVLMPQGEQTDIKYSYELVSHLGIDFFEINIDAPVENIMSGMMREMIMPTEQTQFNLPARVRMTTLYAVSQSFNGRVANTCNLSEDWVGYATRYGDSVGDFSPLSNLTVTEVLQIGEELGLPKELIYKTPIDGLCGRTDEENLGFSYAVLDKYIRTGEIEDNYLKQKIDEMHQKNLFKLLPMPSFKLEN